MVLRQSTKGSDMYQSPFFIEECKNRMTSISNWGFELSEEISDDNWALIGWRLDDIRIVIEYHPYAFTLTTYMDYRTQHLNVGKLYELAGVKDKHVYQFGGAGLEKGIEAITKAILAFLGCYDVSDHTDLIGVVEQVYAQRKPAEIYFLHKADQMYLSGQHTNARKLYEQYEYALNDIQKKRFMRLSNTSSEPCCLSIRTP